MAHKSLKYMLALQEEGNLASAASALSITQSSLSLYLLRLEKEYGISLYDRKRHCMTNAGKLYCEGAREILSLHNDAINEISHLSAIKNISFAIDLCLNESSPALVNALLDQTTEAFPNTKVQISFLSEFKLRDLLQQKKLDLAFSYFQRNGIDNLPKKNIMHESFCLVVPKGFPLSPSNYFSVFEQLKYISTFKDSSIRSAYDAILFSHGISPYIQVESGSYSFTRAMMEKGLYVTLIPAGASGFFREFDLYPLDNMVQVTSGFYYFRETIHLPQIQFFMRTFEELLQNLYKNSDGVCIVCGKELP